jgi:hypothetical protein
VRVLLLLFLNIAFAREINVLAIDTGATKTNTDVIKYLRYYTESKVDHGPAMVHLILFDKQDPVCDNVKVDVCSFSSSIDYLNCLKSAQNRQYDVINLSLNGEEELSGEKELLKELTKQSVVVVSAGNNAKSIDGDGDKKAVQYPASYISEGWANFFVITNHPNSTSNYGERTINMKGANYPAKGLKNADIFVTGTSVSAARFTHLIIKKLCRGDYEFNFVDIRNGNATRDRSPFGTIRGNGRKQFKSQGYRKIRRGGFVSNKTRIYKIKYKRH